MPQQQKQVWHPAQIPKQQNQPAPMPQQVRHPAPMQKQLDADPKQPPLVWYPAPMPQQQKQLTAMPQQVCHPAQMPQKQLAPCLSRNTTKVLKMVVLVALRPASLNSQFSSQYSYKSFMRMAELSTPNPATPLGRLYLFDSGEAYPHLLKTHNLLKEPHHKGTATGMQCITFTHLNFAF